MAMAAAANSSTQGRVDPRSGKYLILELGEEEFGISVMQVKEIMKMQEITTVPQTPRFLQGVINLRGRIVPVVNLRSKFHMPEQAPTERTCIVVVRVQLEGGEQPMGIVVDGVIEVLLLGEDDIEDSPDFGREAANSYVRGMAKSKGRVKILLDIDRVLSGHEMSGVASFAN
ncbi:chemotaxis protein CheW [Granulicella sibirica]|uniref:Chemotaxis protein CheW n=1 Tax=Granulicella sibirica TaxID=2479048 RepID=A0A4Q0T2X4_9BACT|nr:chemotaxis protein CheW [Granulicella sibirica]RXH56289.1 Positive regulator of CheA protein activity (CheW) [Granulicella sibirica]